MILAVVGMAGAGKSEATRFYVQQGYERVYFGGLVLEEVKRRGFPLEQEHERKVREDLREEHGMDAIARLALPRLTELRAQALPVIIDGLYSMAESQLIRHHFPTELVVVAIAAPRHMRYARLGARDHRPLSQAEAIERDELEITGIDKAGPIAMADFTVINDEDLDTLHRRLDALNLDLVIQPAAHP